MKKLLRLLPIFLFSTLLSPAHADLATAEKNYRERFETSPSDRFTESPFQGLYLLTTARDTAILFTEDLGLTGWHDSWTKYDNMKGSPVSAETLITLRKNLFAKFLKTEWMIKLDVSSGNQRVIIYSAPDCPACRSLENDLTKFGGQLNASIFIVPASLADRDSSRYPSFQNAAMCGTNPLQIWKDAMSRRGIERSTNYCPKSRWAELLSFQLSGKTPTVIRQDGTTITGWPANLSLAEVKSRLGVQ